MNLSEIEQKIYLSKTLEDKILLSSVYAQIATGGKDKIYDAINFEKKLIENVRNSFLQKLDVSSVKSENVLHVMSEGSLIGGHTRLCERLAVMGNIKSDLLITRKTDQKLLDRFQSIFNHVELSFCEGVELNIRKQIEILSRYNKIVLHHHPDDIALVIALGVLKSIEETVNIFYVNHADHVFSFGKSIPDVMFHISFRGIEIDSMIQDSAYKSTFLGIPLSISTVPSTNQKFNKFIMAGSSFKMKPSLLGSAPKLVDYLLSTFKSHTFTIVGVRKFDYWWWWKKIKYIKRLTLLPPLPYDKYITKVKQADICVDTIPMTGGTAFVEMYLLGLTPVGINSGVFGYSPIDQVKVDFVTEINFDKLQINHEKLFTQLNEVHALSYVEKRYLDALNGQLHPIPVYLTKKKNNLNAFVRKGKQDISFSEVCNIFSIQSLSFRQKLNLLFRNFKISIFLLKSNFTIAIRDKFILYIKG